MKWAVALPVTVQDTALLKHFLHFIRGAGAEYGPSAADELERLVAKAQAEYGVTFGGYIARLVQQDAQSQGW